jgi:CheY-like chemotaxis protein
MENHYVTNRPPFLRKNRTKDLISQETLMSRNIYSCFQLAKMVVTKVKEIGTKNVILVADDEPLTFNLIEKFFQDANLLCHILPASNGNMAYAIAVSKKPDLIITDWLMPELNGLDLIEQLKANPQTRDIPVIMTTGALFRSEEYNSILAAGAVDCIRKPFDDMELIARVKTALTKKNYSFTSV